MSFECSRREFLRTALGLAALPSLVGAGESVPPVDAPAGDLGPQLEAIFGKSILPGAAALVLRGDRVIAQGVTGVRKKGAPEPITLTDRFHLGSCTKAMTATLVGLFVDEGKLKWNTSVGELFDDVKPLEAWRGVTLRHVLAHRAGLPANMEPALRARLAASARPPAAQRRELVADLLSRPPAAEPGAKYLYSNPGFTLLGAALEKAGATTWEQLIRTRLFAPLEITTADFGAPRGADQPRGHRGREMTPVEPGARGADNPPVGRPAGGVHMTIGDWAKFVSLHLRGDPSNPQRHVRLLRAGTFAALHRPAAGETYVGGWGTNTRPWARGPRPADAGFALTHSGSNTLWYCVVWIAPEIDFAALVACNGFADAPRACDQAVQTLVRAFARKSVAVAD